MRVIQQAGSAYCDMSAGHNLDRYGVRQTFRGQCKRHYNLFETRAENYVNWQVKIKKRWGPGKSGGGRLLFLLSQPPRYIGVDLSYFLVFIMGFYVC